MRELTKLMQIFIATDWDPISVPARQWLDGKISKNKMVAAIEHASRESADCAFDLSSEYARALELLFEWEEPG